MLGQIFIHALAICIASTAALSPAPQTVSITFPSSQSVEGIVYSNFMGISIELSSIDTYIGENTSSIPEPTVNYFNTIRTRANRPLRIRLGGNSMDSSVYVPSQSNMITLTGINATASDQPTTFGPVLFDVLKAVGSKVGGTQYIIGLSLINASSPNVPVLASAAEGGLGDQLDSFILGNEPDLYAAHLERPANYSIDDYIGEFGDVTQELRNSSYGNLLSGVLLSGPSICCNWNLSTIFRDDYLSDFNNTLKYISLQHYPQNDCNNTYSYGIDYYLQHQLVAQLASWELPGVRTAQASSKDVIMGEFNSASCGGIPGISDTFAVTMWIVDYALQMASLGYAAAYIHTRERGVTYNLFDSPIPGNGTEWTTLPAYYGLLPVVEALSSSNGSIIHDLNLNNSMTVNGTVAGYAIYDGQSGLASRLVLFNYANGGSGATDFSLPAIQKNISTSQQVFIRHLSAPNITEKTQISWGGQTLAGVGDGKMIASKVAADEQLDCTNGCTVNVPSPGIAVVWLDASNTDIIRPLANGTRAHRRWLSLILSLPLSVAVSFTIIFVL